MKQKILKWVYDESSNAYDLYFNPYNDSEPEPVATIAEYVDVRRQVSVRSAYTWLALAIRHL